METRLILSVLQQGIFYILGMGDRSLVMGESLPPWGAEPTQWASPCSLLGKQGHEVAKFGPAAACGSSQKKNAQFP